MPVPQFIAEKCRQLHEDGWTLRAIGVATGLCYQTVGKVLKGRIRICEDEDDRSKVVKVHRCKGCGNLVWLDPCAICESEQ